MESIYALVKMCNTQKSLIRALVPKNKGNSIFKLMQISFELKMLSNFEAMQLIYGKIETKEFNLIKDKYKKILHKVLILQDKPSATNDTLVNSLLTNSRDILISRFLMAKRKSLLAEKLLAKSTNFSIKYGFTENIILSSILILRANKGFNKSYFTFNKYNKLILENFGIYQIECLSEIYLMDIELYHTAHQGYVPPEHINKTENYLKELELSAISSSKFTFNKYKLSCFLFEYKKQYDLILINSYKILNLYGTHNLNSISFSFTAHINIMYSLIQLNNLKAVIEYGDKLINQFAVPLTHYYSVIHYMCKANLYALKFEKAICILTKYSDPKKFSGNNFMELFSTTIGYMHLILESNSFSVSVNITDRLPEFKIGKFLNSTPLFSKDKRGINIAILFLHIGFLLTRKDFNAIIDRSDALKLYAYRYLRKDDTFRSNCMIKMILVMIKCDFNHIKTERHTSDLLKKLKSVPLAGSGANIEIEVIPFEILWEIMFNAIRPEKERKLVSSD